MEPTPLIKAHDICVNFNRRKILQHVSLEIQRGEIVTLIGPNGAGKTTLVRVMLGLLTPDSGSIEQSPGLRIGYMPQKLALSEQLPLTARRFLLLAGSISGHKLDSLAREVGVVHLLESPIQSLSGGELQRILLTRALLRSPDLLVLDEPVQGVDVTGQSELYKLIGGIRDRHACGVLMISHDLHLVMAATDQVMCLNQHVCCSGHPETVSRHPAYLELFGAHESSRLAVYTHHHDHTHDIHGNVVTVEEDHHHG
jgi:zinc transport system ATP-binding protein